MTTAPASRRFFDEGGVVRRKVAVEGERAARGHDVVGEDVVLEGDGNAVQGSARPPLGQLAVALIGFGQSVRVDGDDAVELVFVHADAREVKGDELARREAAFLHRRADFRDGGLHDLEWPARRGGFGLSLQRAAPGKGGRGDGGGNQQGRVQNSAYVRIPAAGRTESAANWRARPAHRPR